MVVLTAAGETEEAVAAAVAVAAEAASSFIKRSHKGQVKCYPCSYQGKQTWGSVEA